MTSKVIRKFKREYDQDLSFKRREKLFKAVERLAAKASIAEHRAEGFKESLEQEKKRRTRGKRLNLRGKEDKGAQLYRVAKIQEAREVQANREAVITK